MPVNWKKYPANWKEIRTQILERAKGKCEKCEVRNYSVVGKDGLYELCPSYGIARGVCQAANMKAKAQGEKASYIVIVLTIAHLNHDTADNREENLAALCQRCHLSHDRVLHSENARATWRRKKNKGQGELWDNLGKVTSG